MVGEWDGLLLALPDWIRDTRLDPNTSKVLHPRNHNPNTCAVTWIGTNIEYIPSIFHDNNSTQWYWIQS